MGRYPTEVLESGRGRLALFVRQWLVLRALAIRRYVTTHDLAEEHGVTERSIRRDIHCLQAAGFSIYEEWGESGRKLWRLSKSAKQTEELRAVMSA